MLGPDALDVVDDCIVSVEFENMMIIPPSLLDFIESGLVPRERFGEQEDQRLVVKVTLPRIVTPSIEGESDLIVGAIARGRGGTRRTDMELVVPGVREKTVLLAEH